jgi:hypothetical protein
MNKIIIIININVKKIKIIMKTIIKILYYKKLINFIILNIKIIICIYFNLCIHYHIME